MKCGDANNPAGPILTGHGKPCRNDVIPGTNRCYLHGGAGAATLMKAQQALAVLRMPAIEVMFKAMMTLDTVMEQLQADLCPHCRFPMGDLKTKEQLIKAASAAGKNAALTLDRCGLAPRMTLEIKQSDGDLPFALMLAEEKAELARLMTDFKALKERIRQRLDAPVIDVKKIGDGE